MFANTDDYYCGAYGFLMFLVKMTMDSGSETLN